MILAAFREKAREPHDHRGLPTDMAALVAARDAALEQIRVKP